jgi:hypothetical protein
MRDRYVKQFSYCITGLLLGSLVAWAGLFIWAALTVSPSDSLWDRNPDAANGFFALWLFLAACGGLLGERMARRRP